MRRLFISNLTKLNTQITKQRDAFIDTSNSIDITKSDSWPNQRAAFYNINVFEEMTYLQSFYAFFLGWYGFLSWFKGKKIMSKRRESFNNVWENINHLSFWGDWTFNDLNSKLIKYNEIGTRRNEAVTKLRRAWANYFYKNRRREDLSKEEIVFLNSLSEILNKFSELSKNGILIHHTTEIALVRPIKKLSEQYEMYTDVFDLIEYTLEATNYYTEMEVFIANVKEQVKEYACFMDKLLKSNGEAIINLS